MERRPDYRYWLYEHNFEDTSSFLKYVTNLVKDQKIRINVLLISSTSNLIHIFHEWVPERYIITTNNSESVLTVKVTKKIDENKDLTVRVRVVKYHETIPAYLIISDCRAGEFKDVITMMVNAYYPSISRIFLTNNEMYIIFNKLEASDLSIRVDSSVCKRRLPGFQKKESDIKYTALGYPELFEEIASHDQWIQSIRYTALRVQTLPDTTKVQVKLFNGLISRSSFFYIRQDFEPFIKIILPLVIDLSSVRYKYLSIRSRSAANSKPEPIIIKFHEAIFTDISKNRQFVEVLVELDSCSVSEYHANPYLHISMLDYLDGSSYDDDDAVMDCASC